MEFVPYERIRQLIDLDEAYEAVEASFVEYSTGGAHIPGVMHLEMPERNGALHVKSGHVKGQDICMVKVASTFFDNPGLGLPSISSVHLVFSAVDGRAIAFFDDRGLITNTRTGAAGAVAVQHLAAPAARTLAVIGTGVQARVQVEAIVRRFVPDRVVVWGRTAGHADDFAGHVRDTHGLPVDLADSAAGACAKGDVIVTTTSSSRSAPVAGTTDGIPPDGFRPGSLVVAMGGDSSHKWELATDTVAQADRVIVDSRSQNLALAEVAEGVRRGVFGADRIDAELGQVIAGTVLGRTSPGDRIICKLTGVAVQDIATCALLLQRAGIAS